MLWRGFIFIWIAGFMIAAFAWAPLVPVLEATTRVPGAVVELAATLCRPICSC